MWMAAKSLSLSTSGTCAVFVAEVWSKVNLWIISAVEKCWRVGLAVGNDVGWGEGAPVGVLDGNRVVGVLVGAEEADLSAFDLSNRLPEVSTLTG